MPPTSGSTRSSPQDRRPMVTIGRVDPNRSRQALAVLLTGRPDASNRTIDHFLDLAKQEQFCVQQLWAAYRGDQPIAAMLIVPSAGRTAMCFVSPMTDRKSIHTVHQLAQQACAQQDPQQVRLIQALIDPGQRFEQQALSAAGFTHIACLAYMSYTIDLNSDPGSLALDPTLEALTWTTQRRSLFAEAILASYEDTQDCPGLVGLRHIDDIIDSHMAVGCFTPHLWFVITHERQPVAVLLLNPNAPHHAVELVYLGVNPAWRRRGIGEKLVRFGLACATQHRAASMVLAVDEANAPAKRLYQQLGFIINARKSAMIYSPQDPSGMNRSHR